MSLIDRFLTYVAISSQSDASSSIVPSSEGQWDLARLLEQELTGLGLSEIHLDEHCCLTAVLRGTADEPAIGFVTHLDTADVNLSPEVHPRVVRLDGPIEVGRVVLHDPNVHSELAAYVGQDIIITDGTSVLGADDKAGIAVVMEALEEIISTGTDHPDIYVAFVPDEEIGLRGAKVLDLDRFKPDYAYTVDCEGEGAVAWETFNAGYATVTITGVPAHPMSAKGVMVNPNLVAHDLIACFDRSQTPECTEGREGYIWVQQVSGNQAEATITLNIRDHDLGKYNEKKETIQHAVESVQDAHPRAVIDVEFADVYGNITDCLGDDNGWVVDRLTDAVTQVGLAPVELIMRGGTDGSYLSTTGIPTPNIFTGGFNFHSVREFLPVRAFTSALNVVQWLMTSHDVR